MIHRVADLLAELMAEESRRLSEYHLVHAPTIGKMYEGLTKEILNKSLPSSLGLNVVSGFVTDDTNTLSPQIDCMIVSGSGERIPYTDDHKWHVRNVIAVFEVKKTLYSRDFEDGYAKLRAVVDNWRRYSEESGAEATFNVVPAHHTFAQMTGIASPHPDEVEHLPFETELLYHALVLECVTPIRIILGYDGYSSEAAFREALYTLLKSNPESQGFGASSLPQLSISGSHSLVKMNGLPYSSPLTSDGFWPVLTSTKVNPVLLLLELLWTRLELQFGASAPWGDDFSLETLNGCLWAKGMVAGERKGWHYRYMPADEAMLGPGTFTEWQPTVVSEDQFLVFNQLCEGRRVTRTSLKSSFETSSEGAATLVEGLVATHLVALRGEVLHLTTASLSCAILADGRFAVGENHDGRFTRWVLRQQSYAKGES